MPVVKIGSQMSTLFLPLLCLLFLFFGCAGIQTSHKLDETAAWSTSDPSTIPYEVRMRQFKRGNIVPNASFEQGRILNEGPEKSFVLTGWEKVGQNIHQGIQWADYETDQKEIKPGARGSRCVAIVRDKASEMDAAEGLLSDYIPVIPGNYDFFYNIRLENVRNNRYRLGVKLYDAIVVQVRFFDANKNPVEPEYANPIGSGPIDNSDKSFSFSNYWRIDDFPWGTVRGRTYNYPFSEGDIPDRARYVRLFFGLKGNGTLWLDRVYFGYSKWNFTTLERFSPYFGSKLTATQRISPTPKNLRLKGDIVYYDKTRHPSNAPVIVLPENPAPAERLAAKIIKENIEDGFHFDILEKDFSLQEIEKAGFVISIGNNRLYRELGPELPMDAIHDKSQGYVIDSKRHGNGHVVFLMGETPVANYYAVATALQLFDKNNCIYHDAAVIDYPDFLGRPSLPVNWRNEKRLEHDLDTVEEMSLHKLNKIYFGYHPKKGTWYQPDQKYLKGLAQAGRPLAETGVMDLSVSVHPYRHFATTPSGEVLDDRLLNTWTHGSPESFERLQKVCRIGLEAGARTVLLLSDDLVPYQGTNRQNYGLYTTEDEKQFVNLQNAQAHVINELKKWLDTDYPGTRLEFCPPWYSNEHIDRSEGKAEQYLRELSLQIPEDVAIIWTGPTIRSLSMDMADFHRFRSYIGRWPMLWDNTLHARNIEAKRYGGYTTYYPGKVRMCNLFEPYDAYKPEGVYRLSDQRQIYIGGARSTEIYKIKFATLADYLWNTSDYNPELSLWRTLCRNFGPDCAEKLIRFNDAYYGLYGVCTRMEKKGEDTPLLVEAGNSFITVMDRFLSDILHLLPENHPLAAELVKFRDQQKDRFEKLRSES